MAFLIPYTGVRFLRRLDSRILRYLSLFPCIKSRILFSKKKRLRFWNSFEAVLFFSSACTQRLNKEALYIRTELRVACPFSERIRSYHMVYELQLLASGRGGHEDPLCRALEKIKRVPYGFLVGWNY